MTLEAFVVGLQPFFLFYICLLFFVYFSLFLLAYLPFRNRSRARLSWAELSREPEAWPPVAVILPAFNEEAVIVDCVKNMLRLDYPELEVVVVCDGPSDRTFEVLVEAFEMHETDYELRQDFVTQPVLKIMTSPHYENLRVVLKQNGGKADALNAGLNLARTPLVCCCDADTLIEPKAMRHLVRPYQEDDSTVATSEALMLTNGATFNGGIAVEVRAPRNWWASIQVVEYTRAFYLGRMGFDAFSSMLIISGAFGLFNRHALVAVGGYNPNTVGEDMDIVVKLHRHYRKTNTPYRIAYVPSAVAWTEAPESLKMLRSQRMRWQRGLCEVMIMHRGMPFDKRAGAPGRIAWFHFLFFEALAPVVELLGYLCLIAVLYLGFRHWDAWGAMLALSMALLGVVTLASLLVQQLHAPVVSRPTDILKLLASAVVDMAYFKPLTAIWRVHAMVQFFKGSPARWDPISRKGFDNQKDGQTRQKT